METGNAVAVIRAGGTLLNRSDPTDWTDPTDALRRAWSPLPPVSLLLPPCLRDLAQDDHEHQCG